MKFAAIDIGSNALRLLISRALPVNGVVQFKKVEFIRVPIRLGDDVFRNKRISADKAEMFIKAMQAFKNLIDIHDVNDYRACATSAMREAENGEELINQVRNDVGLDIEIVSGSLESNLILKSVLDYFPEDSNYLLIDVGGGSTEMTVIRNHVPVASISFDLGTVRMMDGMVTKQTWSEIENWVKENTRKLTPLIAIGTGGNINKLYRMGVSEPNKPLPYDKLEKAV